MQQKKQQEFDNYNFDLDLRWKEFIEHDLKDKIPKNSSESILKDIKKIWYKQIVDPDFDTGINLENMEQKQQSNDKSEEKSQNKKSEQNNNLQNIKEQEDQKLESRQIQGSKINVILYHLENLLKAVFLMSTFQFSSFSHYLILLICLMAIYRQLKRPKWNYVYGSALIKNEFTHNIIYMIPYSIFSHYRNILYFIPLMLHCWLGFCEYINLRQGKMYQISKNIVDKTRLNKFNILLLKSKLEIYMVLYHLFNIFIWSFYNPNYLQQNILLTVFYINFLRIKYMLSINLKTAFAQINEKIKLKFDSENTNKIIRYIYRKVVKLLELMLKFKTNENNENEKEQKNKN